MERGSLEGMRWFLVFQIQRNRKDKRAYWSNVWHVQAKQRNVAWRWATENTISLAPVPIREAASFRLRVNVLADRNFSNEPESYLSLDP